MDFSRHHCGILTARCPLTLSDFCSIEVADGTSSKMARYSRRCSLTEYYGTVNRIVFPVSFSGQRTARRVLAPKI